jgi:site-specific DNA-methyltransferase (adenine-specific)
MEAMKEMSDNQFDLAIVDPPYGIDYANEAGKMSGQQYGKSAAQKRNYTSKDWDKEIPTKEYFNNLIRVSKNQIIFGANHFVENIPNANSSCWIVWDKLNGNNDFADCELAYTSFKTSVRKYNFRWAGMLQGDMKNKEIRIHPTQKPVKLYEWLLINYAKEGDTILDTHLGSGSIAIACHNLGFELTGYEIDKEYFEAAKKRIEQHKQQGRLW